MNRTHFTLSVIAASAIAASAASAVTSSTVAGAAADPAVGTEVLDLLCEAAGGTSYWTPYTIARCQGAAARSGVDIERLVCDGLLGGQFSVSATAGRPNRVNWACVAGAPSA
jgi:hypothetical protein